MFRRLFQIHVSIDFPALDTAIAYFKEQDQAEADALRARIVALNGRVQQTAATLRGVVAGIVQQ